MENGYSLMGLMVEVVAAVVSFLPPVLVGEILATRDHANLYIQRQQSYFICEDVDLTVQMDVVECL